MNNIEKTGVYMLKIMTVINVGGIIWVYGKYPITLFSTFTDQIEDGATVLSQKDINQ